MQIEFGADGAMKWERVQPPLWWPSARQYVIADRHLPNSRRQHMVPGHVPPGTVCDNADVIGEVEAIGAEFASRPSHLGRK